MATAVLARERTRTKQVQDLSPSEKAECAALTLSGTGGYGLMQGKLLSDKGTKWATMLRDTDGNLIGWALVFREYSRNAAYFFVDKAWRKQGVGTHLYRSVRRKFGIVKVYPWDNTSRAFFSKVGAT